MEQLARVKPVDCRAMFGGYGLYKNRKFFGIIHKSRLYFKVSDATRASYIDAGMQPFNPFKNTILKSFFEVPGDVLESHQIVDWATDSIRATEKQKKNKK